MNNIEKLKLQKGMLQIKESLDDAMKKAGGVPLNHSELEGMTALYFLSFLSANNIQFIHSDLFKIRGQKK